MSARRMRTRELGLVLAHQLLQAEDLHYGLWDGGLEPSFANLAAAQQRFNDTLLARLPPAEGGVRVLDIGCGTGHLLGQMLERGYLADGLTPEAALADLARARLRARPGCSARVFECRLEEFALREGECRYHVALFSESFQYVPLAECLVQLQRLLEPGGLLLICDFFKTDADGDGGPGDGSFGGGHRLSEFYAAMQRSPFVQLEDEDITRHVSPSLGLVDDLLRQRIKPAASTIRRYLDERHPLLTRLMLWALRRRLARLEYKYFSGHRRPEVFERYKSYRRLLYRLGAPSSG